MLVPLPVRLIGLSGMKLQDVRNVVDQFVSVDHVPSCIVLHVGANDIGMLNMFTWLSELDCVLSYLNARFPHSILVWSEMLPRFYYRHAFSVRAAEKSRIRNQRRARYLISQVGGCVIPHTRILRHSSFLTDGVHLTKKGMTIFIEDLENGITKAVLGEF